MSDRDDYLGQQIPTQALIRTVLKGPSGQTVLGSTEVTIGRALDNTYVVKDPLVSSYHAAIRPNGSGYAIFDLNSTNKIFVNEQIVTNQTEHALKYGDKIRVGNTTFEYEYAVSNPSPATETTAVLSDRDKNLDSQPILEQSVFTDNGGSKKQSQIQKIFFCYAHEDESLLDKVKVCLRPLQRQGLISTWHDRDIGAGMEWEQEISQHLNTAQIILLLISLDFMNSDYCYGIEMLRAIERHERGEAKVIPVILRPVYWQESPLGKLQAPPTDAKPITAWHDQDEAYLNITRGIRNAIEIQKGFVVNIPTHEGLVVFNTTHDAMKKGTALYDLKRYEDALATYDQALRLDPQLVTAHNNKGAVLHALKRYEDALAAYDQALRIDPQFVTASNNKELVLKELRKRK